MQQVRKKMLLWLAILQRMSSFGAEKLKTSRLAFGWLKKLKLRL